MKQKLVEYGVTVININKMKAKPVLGEGNTVLPAVDYSDRYKHIKTEENYMLLLKSGMF